MPRTFAEKESSPGSADDEFSERLASLRKAGGRMPQGESRKSQKKCELLTLLTPVETCVKVSCCHHFLKSIQRMLINILYG